MNTKLLVVAAAFSTLGAFAEVKPVDFVAPQLCGHPSRLEQVCIAKSASTGRFYIARNTNSGVANYVAVDLQPTGLLRPIIGASNQVYRGVGVVNQNNVAVEATVELRVTTPVVPNPVTTAKLLINGKSEQAGYDSFRMEKVAVTQDE